MEARLQELYNLITGVTKQISIPDYQRPYSWKENNIEDLIDSLLNTNQKYFGCIMLCEPKDDNQEIEVVDGQQRLITFSLLAYILHRLYNDFRKINSELEQDKYEKWQDIKRFIKSEGKPRLNLLDQDNKDFEDIMKSEDSLEELLQSNKNSNIFNNFKKLYNCLQEKMEGKNPIEFYLDLSKIFVEKIKIISFKMTDTDDYFEIFQTMNSMGLPLSFSNLVKSRLTSLSHKENQREEFIKKWNVIFKNIDFWQEEFSMGKSYDTHKEHFFNFYLTAEFPEIESFSLRRKKFIETTKKSSLTIDLIEKYSKIYEGFFTNPFNKQCTSSFNRLSIIMRIYDTYVLFPIILKFDKQEKICKYIENYLMRTFGAGKTTYKSINNYLPDIFEKPSFIFSDKLKYPTDKDIADTFNSICSTNIRPKRMLAILEKISEGNTSHPLNLSAQLSLEHIIPQNDSKWDIVSVEDKEYIYHIGNMTLLTPSDNSSAGNGSPEIKKLFYPKIYNELFKDEKTFKDAIKDRDLELFKLFIRNYPKLSTEN